MVTSTTMYGTDFLTQQYMASVGAYDQAITSGLSTTAFNPYSSSVFGYGYNTGYTDYNSTNYVLQNEQVVSTQLQSQQRLNTQYKQYAAMQNAPERALNDKIGVLQQEIMDNKQDTLILRYNEGLQMVKKMYPEMSDAEAKAYFKELYYNATGSNLTDDIKQHGDSDAKNATKKTALFGLGSLFANKRSADDNIREINGTEKTTQEQTREAVSVGLTVAQGVGAALCFTPLAPVGAIMAGVSTIAKWINGAAK